MGRLVCHIQPTCPGQWLTSQGLSGLSAGARRRPSPLVSAVGVNPCRLGRPGGSARSGLREILGAAFGTVPERLGRSALGRDRPDLPPQFRAVDGPSTRRYREHGDRPDPPPCCRPRNPPCVTTLAAGPYVLPGLAWQTYTRSLEAPVIEVKDLACRTDRPGRVLPLACKIRPCCRKPSLVWASALHCVRRSMFFSGAVVVRDGGHALRPLARRCSPVEPVLRLSRSSVTYAW